MMKTAKCAILVLAVMTLAMPVSAAPINLITNGSFELTAPDSPGKFGKSLASLPLGAWDVYQSIPGWFTSAGQGIEIQTSGVVVPAYSGNRLVELDSDPGTIGDISSNSAMTQLLFLGAGQYDLGFWYRPRTDVENDNGIAVFLGAHPLVSADGTRAAMDYWSYIEHTFLVTLPGEYALTFAAIGLDSQKGGFIDDVTLIENPEPGSMMLLGTGLFGLAAAARRRFRK